MEGREMSRIPFSEDEYVLCAYAAMYGAEDIGGLIKANLNGHPPASLAMKVMNIVADLDAKDIKRSANWAPLTGTTTGLGTRFTGWIIVEPLTRLSQQQLLSKCRSILGTK
jgi:hypothetical protein